MTVPSSQNRRVSLTTITCGFFSCGTGAGSLDRCGSPRCLPCRICSFTSVFRILQFFPHLHVEKESSGGKNFLSFSFHHWGNPPIWTVASGSPYSWGGWSLDSSSPSPTPNLCEKTFDLTSFPLCYAMCSPYPLSGNSVIQTEHTHTTDETAITTPYKPQERVMKSNCCWIIQQSLHN